MNTRTVTVRYGLRNGTTGSLPFVGTASAAAVVACIDLFGEQLRWCSARPVRPAAPATPITTTGSR